MDNTINTYFCQQSVSCDNVAVTAIAQGLTVKNQLKYHITEDSVCQNIPVSIIKSSKYSIHLSVISQLTMELQIRPSFSAT